MSKMVKMKSSFSDAEGDVDIGNEHRIRSASIGDVTLDTSFASMCPETCLVSCTTKRGLTSGLAKSTTVHVDPASRKDATGQA